MSGPPLDFDPLASVRPEAGTADTRDAPTFGEQAGASMRVAADEGATTTVNRLDGVYAEVATVLAERTGGNASDYTIGFGQYVLNQVNPFADQSNFDGAKIWREIQRIRREEDPGFAKELGQDQSTMERELLTRQGRTFEDEELLSRGKGASSVLAQIAGGAPVAMLDAPNLAGLALGVGPGVGPARAILTEGILGAGIEATQIPGAIDRRAAIGKDTTGEDIALRIGGAFVGSAAFRGVVEGGKAGARALNPNAANKELARALADMVPANLRSPEQEAALSILRRQSAIEEASPYVRTLEGDDVHLAKMEAALQALEEGRVPTSGEVAGAGSQPATVPTARAVFNETEKAQIKRAIAGPESGGDDFADNALGSSAAGRYQFIEETFTSLYRREYRVSAAQAQKVWDSDRYNVEVQERLMDRLLDENAAALEKAGFARTPGNLYLSHFAGVRKAVELLEADPSLPVARFFSERAVRQNPTYLGGGRTVAEAIETIRGKVGDESQVTPAPLRDGPELRDPALDAERAITPLTSANVADEIGGEIGPLIDPLRAIVTGSRRSLNQFDALADELGSNPAAVKTALEELLERGVLARNSQTGAFMRKPPGTRNATNIARPRTLIEFLAERGGLNDYGGDLQALGIRANDKRFGKAVIRNTRQPDGEVIKGDGAYSLDRAFRDARDQGYFPELEGVRESGYDDLLDERALILEAIDEELSGLPRYRMDDWDRLEEYKLRGSTEETYGGFVRGELGDESAASSLRADFEQAWIDFGNDAADLDPEFLDRAAALYQSGEAFLPEQAIAMAVREDYELTLRQAIEEGLEREYGNAYDPWHPKWQEKLDKRFNEQLASAEPDGATRQGSERERAASRAGSEDSQADAGRRQNDQETGRLTEAKADALAAARPRSDHTDLPGELDPRFAEVDSEGIRATSESLWHDIAATDPSLRARQRQEAQLRADAPLRGENATGEAQDGTIGLELFDQANQPKFDLGDGAGERTAAEIRADLDSQKSGIEAMKECLT